MGFISAAFDLRFFYAQPHVLNPNPDFFPENNYSRTKSNKQSGNNLKDIRGRRWIDVRVCCSGEENRNPEREVKYCNYSFESARHKYPQIIPTDYNLGKISMKCRQGAYFVKKAP